MVKRERELSGFDFFVLLVFGLVSSTSPSLGSLVSLLNYRISKQALNKWYTKEAVRFFQKIFSYICRIKFDNSLPISVLSYFSSLLVCDSTWWELFASSELEDAFKKFGGSHSKNPQCKLQLVFDYSTGSIEQFELDKSTKDDTRMGDKLLELLQCKSLILVDLGYFSLKFFHKVAAKGAFFISRFRYETNIYDDKKKKLDLLAILDDTTEEQVELDVLVGVEDKLDLRCRVIAEKLPRHIQEKRKENYRTQCRKAGRKPQERHLQLLSWNLFFTNIPEKIMPASLILIVYTIRWQIELIFKTLKSVLKINFTTVRKNVYRIYCETYGRLILAAFLSKFKGGADTILWQEEEEISFDKVCKRFVEQANSIAELALECCSKAFQKIIRLFQDCLRHCKKDKRRKKSYQTTREKIYFGEKIYFKKIVLKPEYYLLS